MGRTEGCSGQRAGGAVNRVRLRVVRRWKKPAPTRRASGAPPVPRPADLDNPYSPCYREPRSFAQLRPRTPRQE